MLGQRALRVRPQGQRDPDLRRNRRQHRARERSVKPRGTEPGRFIGRRSTWLLPRGRVRPRGRSAFAPTELRLPHGGASARFGFETVKPPQYSVTVKVVQKDAGTPVEDAQVRLGVYFAYSDPTGLARVAMPQGTYSLDVLKTGYEALSRVLDVNDDVTVEVEVAVIPPENPDAYWLFDPTKRQSVERRRLLLCLHRHCPVHRVDGAPGEPCGRTRRESTSCR